MLFVNHAVHKPDQDAGSRTIDQLLRLFLSKQFRIRFWAEDGNYEGPYASRLREMGIAVKTRNPTPFPEWIARNGAKFDVIFLSRPVFGAEVLETIRKSSRAKILYYGHDIHHTRLARQIAHDGETPQLAARARRLEKIETATWRAVDTVYYPAVEETLHVEEFAKANGFPVQARTLPVFGFDSFDDDAAATLTDRSGLLFVGGFRHAPNVSGILWFIANVWPEIIRAAPATTLYLLGSNPPPEIAGLASGKIVVTGFIPDDVLADHYRRARIVIAPLLFGAGMKGKVVEGMRFGVPVVTTTVGAQGLADATDALSVSDAAEVQADLVLKLLSDDDLWRRRSTASLAYARRHFSRAAMWSALEDRL